MTQVWKFGDISYDTVFAMGDASDRVIETVGNKNGKHFELGYYNGDGKPKAIINISPALGCAVGCNFCDLVDAGPLLSAEEMLGQVDAMVTMVKEIDGLDLKGKPLKINYAKTGEPTYNKGAVRSMELIADKYPGTSFKYSTVMPNAPHLLDRIGEVARFANDYKGGSVQLTISLISTDEAFRLASARPGRLADFNTIREGLDTWHIANPNGRTPNCSLLVGEGTPCVPAMVRDVFPPDRVRFRIRPIIPNTHSSESEIEKASEAKLQEVMQAFKAQGYHISDAGKPTPTEVAYGLASNVMRRRMEEGGTSFPKGVLENPKLYQLGETWTARTAEDEQNPGAAASR